MDGPLVGESDGCHIWASVGVRKLCEWYANFLAYWILVQFLFEAHQNYLWKPRQPPRLPLRLKLNPNINSQDFTLGPGMAHLVVLWYAKTMGMV